MHDSQNSHCGIVVACFTRYGETSIIANVFTMFGLQSYIVNGVRTKKAKTSVSTAHFGFDMVYHKETPALKNWNGYPYRAIPNDMRARSWPCFWLRFWTRPWKNKKSPGRTLWLFWNGMIELDTLTRHREFSFVLLDKLSRYLGFYRRCQFEILGDE